MVSASSTSIPTITLGASGLFSDFPDFLAGMQHLVVERPSSLSADVTCTNKHGRVRCLIAKIRYGTCSTFVALTRCTVLFMDKRKKERNFTMLCERRSMEDSCHESAVTVSLCLLMWSQHTDDRYKRNILHLGALVSF